MIITWLLLLGAISPAALADVQFTSPSAGQDISGDTISIAWKDSGDSPPIADLTSYQIFLCAGGNIDANFIPLATIVTNGNFKTDNTAVGTFTTGLGANVENAYFLKMISVAAAGGDVINYSDRFSLTSMVGTFPSVVKEGLQTVKGTTSGPPTENQIANPPNAAADTVAAEPPEFKIPYTLQTGEIRYAPMPPVPATKITAKNVSPQWPTSSYTVYQTIAGKPNAVSTVTDYQTFSVSSIENTVRSLQPGTARCALLTSCRSLPLNNQQTQHFRNGSTGGKIKWTLLGFLHSERFRVLAYEGILAYLALLAGIREMRPGTEQRLDACMNGSAMGYMWE